MLRFKGGIGIGPNCLTNSLFSHLAGLGPLVQLVSSHLKMVTFDSFGSGINAKWLPSNRLGREAG